MLISTTLFECNNVSVFKIPPGKVSLSKWKPKLVVWRGSLRLIKEEQTLVSYKDAPHEGLRMKLELYNKVNSESPFSPFDISQQISQWAEVWYNPFSSTNLKYRIANDKSDTIVMTPQSPKYYKIITQLPGSGYLPFPKSSKGVLLQVALGLSFESSNDASYFEESMGCYKRHFHNYQKGCLSNVSDNDRTYISYGSSNGSDVTESNFATTWLEENQSSSSQENESSSSIDMSRDDDYDDEDEFCWFTGSS